MDVRDRKDCKLLGFQDSKDFKDFRDWNDWKTSTSWVGPYLSGKLIWGADQRGHGLGCFALRVYVAPSLPLRREVGAALGFGWRLSGVWLAFGRIASLGVPCWNLSCCRVPYCFCNVARTCMSVPANKNAVVITCGRVVCAGSTTRLKKK